MPIAVKLSKADIQINNSLAEKDLRKQVVDKVIPKIYQKLGYIDTMPINDEDGRRWAEMSIQNLQIVHIC